MIWMENSIFKRRQNICQQDKSDQFDFINIKDFCSTNLLLTSFFFDWEEIFPKSRTNHGSLSREEECLILNQNYEETGMKINRKIVKGEKKEESEAQTTSKYSEMVKLTRCQRNAR